MRDFRTRTALIGLILAFPALMMLASPRKSSLRDAALPLLAVEAVLVGGLTVATRERVRLTGERTTAEAPPALHGRLSKAARSPGSVRRAHIGRL